MKKVLALVTALALSLTAFSRSAQPARAGRTTTFVLFDRLKTGLPVMQCQLPAGWVGSDRMFWFEGTLQPVRYFASAYDTFSDDCMALGSCYVRQPRWEYQRMVQARELTDPKLVAQHFVREVALQYRLKNVRVTGATATEDKSPAAVSLMKNRVKAARAHGVVCSAIVFRQLRLRFLGERRGRVFAVNYAMPYLIEEINGMSTVGTLLSVDSCCSLAEPARERALLSKLAAFAASRRVCNAFEKAVDRKVHERKEKILKTREEILQIMQDVNAYKEEVYTGSSSSWESVVRDTSIVKSENGLRYRVDGNFDNYRIDEAANEYICWNSGDVDSSYNPGNDERLGGHNWKEGVKEH